MAILPMERIHLVAMKRDRKSILEMLQRRGAVEVSDIQNEDEVFTKADTATTCGLFEKNAETARSAMEILLKHTDIKKPSLAFLHGREAISVETNDAFYEKRDDVLRDAQRIVQLQRNIAEAKAEQLRLEAGLEALVPWMDLPVPQTFGGTRKTAVFIGTLEGEHNLEGVLAQLAEAAPDLAPLHVEIVSGTKQQTSLLVMSLKKDATRAEDALRAIGFARPPAASHLAPAVQKQRLEEQMAEATKTVADAEEEIRSYAGQWDDFRFLEDHMTMRAEKYGVIEKLAQSAHTFVLQGYIPAGDAPALQQELTDTFLCSVDLEDAGPTGDEVPVKLKNNWFSEPTESVLEAYSMPGKGEIDPTSVMSIFYYVMFGLMFSDAGYGLIMAGVCGFCYLKFRKNLEPNWSKNIRMFFWCGISTIFWGVIFSSYFGDVVDVVSQTFFGHTVSIPPVWFYPMEKPMLLLVFSLGIGTIHLTAGYIMKAVTCARQKDYSGILYDAVFPIAMWYPLILILLGSDMFVTIAGFKLTLPSIVTPICLAVSGVAIIGIVFTGGRESKNWGKRLLKGIYAVYNGISGWLSDTLSYSRLLALGLATGVIASVMNQLGALVGSGFFGVVVFIIVFAVGQALNFGINVLGAYVHSNRLEYVEFFGKFYDGGGRKFSPFGIHTKHYKIIEEETKS
ncbi:V-type ATP synthase subunit I [Ruminococcaceae bacterium OttesenSCG-928-O06]|nr:V-type ATP synthase subunit I [Ruminococcaceae bacterium OttesenSCG-928-O06]